MNHQFQILTEQLTEWLSLQPLKKDDNDRLWRKLRLDWNYHSNHIEGNTLSYGETEILLIHGQATGDHGLRDYMEMRAHDVAIDHMKALVLEERPLTEVDIRDFNRILLKEPFWKDAITADGQPSRIEILPGEYKKQPNNVRTASGEIFRFADPAEVAIKMNELVIWLRDELAKNVLHPIEIASKLHHDFVLIHPFGDGNGRTARILVNYVLMRNGYLPLIVTTEQKDKYLASLRKADAGDLEALTDFLTACSNTSMNRGISAAKGESIEEPDDLMKEIELFKRRQNGEAKKVLPKSDKMIKDLYLTNLRPLFTEFVEMMGRMSDLFAEIRITTNFATVQGNNWQQAMNQWAASPNLKNSQNLQLVFDLRGFKGNASAPFNISSQLNVSFGEFHYVISIAGKNGENRLYGQPIAESEMKNLLRPALEKAFTQIKKQSGEK
jgi:Fic family protein